MPTDDTPPHVHAALRQMKFQVETMLLEGATRESVIKYLTDVGLDEAAAKKFLMMVLAAKGEESIQRDAGGCRVMSVLITLSLWVAPAVWLGIERHWGWMAVWIIIGWLPSAFVGVGAVSFAARSVGLRYP